jgi:hypothetical protein
LWWRKNLYRTIGAGFGAKVAGKPHGISGKTFEVKPGKMRIPDGFAQAIAKRILAYLLPWQ